MDTLPKNRTGSADTPKSPASVSDPLPRDRGRRYIGDMCELKSANHRTALRSDPNSRWSHGKFAYNLAAHMHGRSGPLPNLPPTSRDAWGHDAHRITERIVAWMSWARPLFVTVEPTMPSPHRVRTIYPRKLRRSVIYSIWAADAQHICAD